MITHLVLLKPRVNLTEGDRELFTAAFARAVREIPTVRGVRIGRRVRPGAGDETTATDTADFMASIDFEDLTGLQTYLAHPAHAELGRRFGEILGSAVIYDFEVGGIEMLGPTADFR